MKCFRIIILLFFFWGNIFGQTNYGKEIPCSCKLKKNILGVWTSDGASNWRVMYKKDYMISQYLDGEEVPDTMSYFFKCYEVNSGDKKREEIIYVEKDKDGDSTICYVINLTNKLFSIMYEANGRIILMRKIGSLPKK